MSDDINKKDDDAVNETPKTSADAPETTDAETSASEGDKPKTFGKGAKKETDESEAMDFDKEIENLDEFLMESEEDDDDLSLDDDDDMLTASSFGGQEKTKSGAGKYVGYFVFLLLLCGLAYGGVVYGPQMFNNPDLEAFQQNMANRSEQFETDISAEDNIESTDVFDTAATDTGVPRAPSAENMSDVEPLPSASDEIAETDMSIPSDEAAMDEVATEEAQIERANTIADALALTQSAETEEMPSAQVDDVVIEEIEVTDVSEVETVTEEEFENALDVETETVAEANDNAIETQMPADEIDGFERTNAVSLTEARMQEAEAEENLPPLEEEQIAIANDVMEMPEEEITEVVEAVDQVAEDTQQVADSANMTVEAEEALVEEAIKETVETSTKSESPVESEQVAEAVRAETEKMVETASGNNSVVEEDEINDMEVTSVIMMEDVMEDPTVAETNEDKAMEDVEGLKDKIRENKSAKE